MSRKNLSPLNGKTAAASIIVIFTLAFIFLAPQNGGGMNIFSAFFSKENNQAEYMNLSILVKDEGLEIKEYGPLTFFPTYKSIYELNTMEQLTKYVYNIEPSAYVTYEDLAPEKLLEKDIDIDLRKKEPAVLIFHTHSQEFFMDSKDKDPNESIVGVGERLANILAQDYGISVVHDIGSYDIADRKLVRGSSYENMEPAVSKILEKYPDIELVIDLHRDGVPDHMRLVQEISGKATAKIMFFNGINRYNDNGNPVELEELKNPYVPENLALSLRLFLTANELYPGLARKNYIKPYRYSLHFKPMSMLVEVGANTSTLEEAMNAMEPLAEIIVKTLEGEQ